MLVCEYNYAEDIATQRAEEGRIAYSKGRIQGRSGGFSDGVRETARLMKDSNDAFSEIYKTYRSFIGRNRKTVGN